MSEKNTSEPKNEKFYVRLIIALSIAVPVAVALLFLMPEEWKVEIGIINTRSLPFFHAVLNGSTALLLVIGLMLIKRKNILMHKRVMLTAFTFSALFLVSYVIARISTPHTVFGGEGAIKSIYYFILFSHIFLSIFVLPLAMFAIYRGLTAAYDRHKKVVRYAFPIWLYVAVTGVLVYIFMAPYY